MFPPLRFLRRPLGRTASPMDGGQPICETVLQVLTPEFPERWVDVQTVAAASAAAPPVTTSVAAFVEAYLDGRDQVLAPEFPERVDVATVAASVVSPAATASFLSVSTESLKRHGVLDVKFTLAPGAADAVPASKIMEAVAAFVEAYLDGKGQVVPHDARRLCPWKTKSGREIREGDRLRHPVGGQTFVVVFDISRLGTDQLDIEHGQTGCWRAVYDDDVTPSSFLGLQIDRGQAEHVDAPRHPF